jgi:hypothetical protein
MLSNTVESFFLLFKILLESITLLPSSKRLLHLTLLTIEIEVVVVVYLLSLEQHIKYNWLLGRSSKTSTESLSWRCQLTL